MRQKSAELAKSLGRPCFANHSPITLLQTSNRRSLQIQSTPSSSNDNKTIDTFDAQPSRDLTPPTTGVSPDARFEVLGGPSSLLSVSLSASQNLFTRRGTLVGVSGSPENVISTLSPLSPLRRAVLGITFMYQRVASTTPVNLLIGTKAPHTSFSVIHMDGRVDWTVAQRQGLVAWTGHTLSVKSSANLRMSLAHWGNTILTGRGLVALAGSGQIYQITLNQGETYIAHPSNILAYTLNTTPPSPYRFKSSTLRLQIPSLSFFFSSSKFMRTMATTTTWKAIANAIHTIRTWARRTFWGDRLFLSFTGPTTLLLQSRGSSLRDSLSSSDVTEIAEAPVGVLYQAPANAEMKRDAEGRPMIVAPQKVKMSYASVDKAGRVAFEGGEKEVGR